MHIDDLTPSYSEILETVSKLRIQNKILRKALRDEFAASAMNAIIIGCNADVSSLHLGAAKDAYGVADAMLEAREL